MKREHHEQEMSDLEDSYIDLVRQLETERDKHKADAEYWKRLYKKLDQRQVEEE